MSNKEIKSVPLQFERLQSEVMLKRSADFSEHISTRRTVREFSEEQVPDEVIRNCLHAAGSAPSGANRQPWHFVVVKDPDLKNQIRVGAEAEEKEFYESRAPRDWLEALTPLGTDANKPFLETAPCLIVIFGEKFSHDEQGKKQKNYYVTESVGIATGILITALHGAGLATLTHTPAPMKFLNKILDRPVNEKPYMILVVGYPADGATVPAITRKPLEQIASFL